MSKFIKIISTPVVLGFLTSMAMAQEPIVHRCNVQNPNYQVRILGHKGDLIEIHNLHTATHLKRYEWGRDQMGGKAGKLTCDDIVSTSHMIGLRTGWQNDILQIWLLPASPSDKTLYVHYYPALDHHMHIKAKTRHPAFYGGSEAILSRQGKHGDVRISFCWNSATKTFAYAAYSGAAHRNGSELSCNKQHAPQVYSADAPTQRS